MPIARYFTVVGSALVVLLLIAGRSLPEPMPSFPDRPEIINSTTIRIRSERKWPEKIVLDSNRPTFSPLSIEVAQAQQLVEPLPDEMADRTSVDAPAKPNPDARPIDARRQPALVKRKLARAFPSTHVARARHRKEPPGTEECCRFEWAERPEMPRAAPRRRVARQDPWG